MFWLKSQDVSDYQAYDSIPIGSEFSDSGGADWRGTDWIRKCEPEFKAGDKVKIRDSEFNYLFAEPARREVKNEWMIRGKSIEGETEWYIDHITDKTLLSIPARFMEKI